MLSTRQDETWARIEAEKRRDRFVRRLSIGAWTATFAVLLIFAVITGVEVARTLERVQAGAAHSVEVVAVLMPLLTVVGTVSLLIAVLSTVGVFLRLRTTSLSEIHLRLAALEEMLLAEQDPSEEGTG